MSYRTDRNAAPASVTTVVAAVVVDQLVRAGIRWFVYCPGSRNGPLGFALARRAATGEIELQVRVDERSAALAALGITESTGVPAAVVTTSGTAVSNLLPAVTEARYSGLPLVLVTVNRPPEVLGTGASQSVEQAELLTSQVRHVQPIWFGDVLRPDTNGIIRSQVCRALGIGAGRLQGMPGPVQIDVPPASGQPRRRGAGRRSAGGPRGRRPRRARSPGDAQRTPRPACHRRALVDTDLDSVATASAKAMSAADFAPIPTAH